MKATHLGFVILSVQALAGCATVGDVVFQLPNEKLVEKSIDWVPIVAQVKDDQMWFYSPDSLKYGAGAPPSTVQVLLSQPSTSGAGVRWNYLYSIDCQGSTFRILSTGGGLSVDGRSTDILSGSVLSYIQGAFCGRFDEGVRWTSVGTALNRRGYWVSLDRIGTRAKSPRTESDEISYELRVQDGYTKSASFVVDADCRDTRKSRVSGSADWSSLEPKTMAAIANRSVCKQVRDKRLSLRAASEVFRVAKSDERAAGDRDSVSGTAQSKSKSLALPVGTGLESLLREGISDTPLPAPGVGR